MKAVILAGGEGTRLRPLTCNTPKPMVPILNRPFLQHLIDYLKAHGIDDIILTLCYLPHHIQSYFGDGSDLNVKLTYVVETSPLGTAGAVKNVTQHLGETFFVFNGDVFTNLDLTQMMGSHRELGAKVTIALTPVEDPTIYGLVETGAEDRVERFIEKPQPEAVTTNMINAGSYIVEPDVLDYVPQGRSSTFERELFPLLLERGHSVYGYPSDAYWIDIGTPEKYLRLHHDLLRGEIARSFPGERAGEGIWVEEGCKIHPRAALEGPVIIGRDCIIDSRAKLKGPSVIGQGCHIGEDSLIEGAVIWQQGSLGQGVVLKNCVVAEHVSIGDRSQIREGCVLGADVVIGCDQTLDGGTRLWPPQYPPSPHPKRR